jgi:multiple antibiotic resistance protein
MLVRLMSSFSLLLRFFALSFSALLPLINPLGSALMILGLVGRARPDVYRRLALKIAICTTIFLLVIEVAGTAVLAFFGISLHVVQVAGGLVLASMGWGLLNQKESDTNKVDTDVNQAEIKSLQENIFYPLTFPVTAGPGCIVVMLTLSAHASAKTLLSNFMGHFGIALAVVVLSILVFICYAYAPKISARISPQTAQGIVRVIAFVLLCIGVQITWNGVETMLRLVIHS